MICQLCKNERKLVEAHIIPRSFHRLDPAERYPARLLTNVDGRYPQKIRKGVYDSEIVCEECEHRFSSWDDYACELFIHRWGEFESIQHKGSLIAYQLMNYDYVRLKLFFISLLWRASVSRHVMFSQISVGPHTEALRNAILSSNPGDGQFYAPVLQAFDSTLVGMLNPHPERFYGIRFQRFYVGHIIARIKVDSRSLPTAFDSLSPKPSEPLILASKDYLQSPERRIMKNLVLADRERNQSRQS